MTVFTNEHTHKKERYRGRERERERERRWGSGVQMCSELDVGLAGRSLDG